MATEHDWLIEYLRDRDAGCPLCGYNLRGLLSDRCPECGREVRLSVLRAEPHLRAWVTAAVAMGASAGIGMFVLAVIIKEGWPPPRMFLLSISLCYFLASIPVFAGLVFARGRFLRLPKSSQSFLATGSIVLTVLALLLFFAGISR